MVAGNGIKLSAKPHAQKGGTINKEGDTAMKRAKLSNDAKQEVVKLKEEEEYCTTCGGKILNTLSKKEEEEDSWGLVRCPSCRATKRLF